MKGSLEANTVDELRAKCIKHDIKYSGLRKAELIAALRKKELILVNPCGKVFSTFTCEAWL